MKETEEIEMTEAIEVTEERGEAEVEADLSATNVVDLVTLLETVTRLAEGAPDPSATVATREGTWRGTAPRVIERATWSAISAMKSVILPRSAKVISI